MSLDLSERAVPLEETEDPDALDAAEFDAYRRTLRDLVVAGGKPYVLITLDAEDNSVQVTHVGVKAEGLPLLFGELVNQFAHAGYVHDQQPETD